MTRSPFDENDRTRVERAASRLVVVRLPERLKSFLPISADALMAHPAREEEVTTDGDAIASSLSAIVAARASAGASGTLDARAALVYRDADDRDVAVVVFSTTNLVGMVDATLVTFAVPTLVEWLYARYPVRSA